MAQYQNLSPAQVKAKLDNGESFRLIDVREPQEHAAARIEGAELMPMSRAQEWVDSLSPDEQIVFFCHHGMRSAQVAQFFAGQRSFANVANMSGGIDAWSAQVDPSVSRY
jgi:rhodanese-related sulfurtransferase